MERNGAMEIITEKQHFHKFKHRDMNPQIQNLNPESIFQKLTNSVWKYAFESFTSGTGDPNRQKANNILFLIVVAILAYAGVEATQLIFRKNL